MNIDLPKLKYYYLTHSDNLGNADQLEKELDDLDINRHLNPHYPLPGIHQRNKKRRNIIRRQSGGRGYVSMIEKAYPDADFDSPKGFFEDDAGLWHKAEIVQIPDDADLLYIGVSRCAGKLGRRRIKVGYEIVNGLNDILRVYNMMSMHGVVVCSQHGLNLLLQCMSSDISNNMTWDISLARSQSKMKAYALKKPMVYQRGKHKGVTMVDLCQVGINCG